MILRAYLLALAAVAIGAGRVYGQANGSSGWSSKPGRDLPAGWSSAKLESGEYFYFRVDEPEQIFWELPAEEIGGDGDAPAVPVSLIDHAPSLVGAAKDRRGEIIGEIELCDTGHMGGLQHEYAGLLNFMRRYGFHYINKHPQQHTSELVYSKSSCKKGHLEPHIKFVDKSDRGVMVEYMSLQGRSATEILTELQARGIDPTHRHTAEPVKRQQRNKWGQTGALSSKEELR